MNMCFIYETLKCLPCVWHNKKVNPPFVVMTYSLHIYKETCFKLLSNLDFKKKALYIV